MDPASYLECDLFDYRPCFIQAIATSYFEDSIDKLPALLSVVYPVILPDSYNLSQTMPALPRTVAVVHTPLWNASERELPEEERQDIFTPRFIYFSMPDKTGHGSHISSRRRKRDSQSKTLDSQLDQYSPQPKTNRPEQTSESAFSSPSITCNFNMTDFERFILSDTGKEAQPNKYSYYNINQSTKHSDLRPRKRKRVDGVKMAEKEIREYERWVFGTWENIFSGSYSYSG